VGDPAVRAVRPKKQEQVVGEVVAADLGRGPSDGDRERGRGTEAQEPRDPLGLQDRMCSVLARRPQGPIVLGTQGVDTGEMRAVIEEVDGEVHG
jgi:hypothetical protein